MSEGNGLPRGWKPGTIGEYALSMKNGLYKSRECYSDTGIPCLRMYNIDEGRLVWENVKRMILSEQEVAEYGLSPGDLLVNRVNSRELVGKACVIPRNLGPCVFESKNIRLRIDTDAVDPAFLNYNLLLSGRRHFSNNAQQTVGMASVNQDQLSAFQFPVAPLDEQRRIVARIEELFSDLDAGVAALERVRANLKRYRSSVLKAAVEGRLTEQWRAEHPDVEPAAVLLERILAERRARWEADQLARFEAAGKKPPKGWKEKYVQPAAPDRSKLPALPKGWCWATATQTAAIQGGIQKQPSRAPRQNAYPYLRVANVLRNKLDLTEIEQFELLDGELERLRLEPGDLLIVEGNGSRTEIGRSAIWKGEIANCVHQNHIIRVRPIEVQSKYLNAYWNSPQGQSRVMAQAASTSGLYTLSVTKVAALPMPLPPLNEQGEIIAAVERQLSIADEAAVQIDSGQKRAVRLRQSILKRAFEGRLVYGSGLPS